MGTIYLAPISDSPGRKSHTRDIDVQYRTGQTPNRYTAAYILAGAVQPMARPLQRLQALQRSGCKADPAGSSSRLRTGFYSLWRSAESSRVQTQRDRLY